MSSFVHLHNHSDFSLLDGAVKVEWYAQKAAELGMSHVALTDHGTLFGALHFERACHNHGVKPIIGCEAYVASGSRFEKTQQSAKFHHLLLFCRNEEGYRNLMKLVSKSYTEGFYYKPRIDDQLLREHAQGLMASSACLAGEIPQLLLSSQFEEAEKRTLFYADLFGKDNFWLEVMNHGLEDEAFLRGEMKKLAARTKLPLLATNNVHYLNAEHAEAQHILCCIGDNRSIHETRRTRIHTPEYYFKTAEQMMMLFKDMPEAVENTLALAERCDFSIPKPGPILPEYQVPQDFKSKDEYFCHLVDAGVKQRYGEKLSEEIEERVKEEVQVICELNFVGYFLIVWDFIKWARDHKISVGPGRGSGAGSIVAYALQITDVEPLKYNLLFERFLNRERVSMPDFDIDFCFERRNEVINYVTQRYGQEKVAGICTLGTLKTKAVLKDVARVLEIPFNDANLLTSLVPEGVKNVAAALQQEKQLQELCQKNETYEKLFAISSILEGMSRHVSTHACGMVIGRQEVSDYVPLYRDAKTGAVSTQYTMDLIEDCGLVKMDFLGLKTLTLLDQVESLIRQKDKKFNLEHISEHDSATFKMLSSGASSAVFQFESEGMQRILRRFKPDTIEDLIALNALYRPGPMQFIDSFVDAKNGHKAIVYPHPDLEDVLKPTYGVIVYQEQVMEIARIIGGFSLGKADILRRAMGKKKEAEMLRMKDEFVAGALKKGYQQKKAEDIFELLKPFAGYGFNKSHAAAYALLAYKTAYCRANYSVEFMAANLTNEIGNPTTFNRYLNEIRTLKITLSPPTINASQKYFSVFDNKVVYGLTGIKGIGEAAVEEILHSRQEKGNFTSFLDLLYKVPLHSLNKKALEALIKAGVFDRIEKGYNRATLLYNLDSILPKINKSKSVSKSVSLFEGLEDEIQPDLSLEAQPDFDLRTQLEMEKEVTGFYLSGHPLDDYRELSQSIDSHNLTQIEQLTEGEKLTALGIVREFRLISTKNDKKMAVGRLETFYEDLDVVAFPTVYKEISSLFFENTVVVLSGKVELQSNQTCKLRIEQAYQPLDAPLNLTSIVHLELGELEFNKQHFLLLRDFIQKFSGSLPVVLHFKKDGRSFKIKLPNPLCLIADRKLIAKLPQLAPSATPIKKFWLTTPMRQ